MCITGSLTDFSLAEIFRLLDQGHHTGLLTIHTGTRNPLTQRCAFYIWVYQGKLVAIANQLDSQGLVKLIKQQDWMDECQLAKWVKLLPHHQPLGTWLKQQGILTAKQIQWLFKRQILQPIYTLFQIQDGQFKFSHNVPIPITELTGLNLNMAIATLMGLRQLQNWEGLAQQLPNPNAGLISRIVGQPPYRLDPLEWQVWEYTKGTVSLFAIAKQLRLPVGKVQQVAFRLIAVGLVEEVPLIHPPTPNSRRDDLPPILAEERTNSPLSPSFLQNLTKFLGAKSKAVLEQPSHIVST